MLRSGIFSVRKFLPPKSFASTRSPWWIPTAKIVSESRLWCANAHLAKRRKGWSKSSINFVHGFCARTTNVSLTFGSCRKTKNANCKKQNCDMINSDHLLELADEEARRPGAGAPRQANLRRSISTAYYAVFHELLGTVAKKFGRGVWKSQVLFYRSLEHRRTRDRCKKLAQNPLSNEERDFFGWQSFPDALRFFASRFVDLQELRHQADYDPDTKFTAQEAQEAAADAREAIDNLRAVADQDEALIPFLSYLLLGLRQ
jgi:hypothetical protein